MGKFLCTKIQANVFGENIFISRLIYILNAHDLLTQSSY